MTDRQTAQSLATTLTTDALAERLRTLADDVRAFDPEQRRAFLLQAAARLVIGADQLADAYAALDAR